MREGTAEPTRALTSGELWSALLRASLDPKLLRPDLDAAEVVATGDNSWRRELGFGALTIIETLEADAASQTVRQHTLFPPTLAGGSRTVSIRVESDHGLALHFAYHSPHLSADPELGDAHRTAFQAAYQQADADQVERLLLWIGQQRGGGC